MEANTHQAQKKPVRRLDYLADLLNGNPFDMIPSLLSKAYLEKKIPEPKFRLILLMIHHGPGFEIWRSTLEKTVSKASLKRYLPELAKEGYIEIESIKTGRGGAIKNVYHVQSLEHWELYKNHVSPNGSLVNGSALNGSPVEDITRTNSNHNKGNNNTTTNNMYFIDMLSQKKFADSKAWFEALNSEAKKTVMTGIGSRKLNYDEMTEHELIALMDRILKEHDFKCSAQHARQAPKKPLGKSLGGIYGPRHMIHTKLRTGEIPYNGPEELNQAVDALEQMFRRHGEDVTNWLDACIELNRKEKLKTKKVSMSCLFHSPDATFETYMKGVK